MPYKLQNVHIIRSKGIQSSSFLSKRQEHVPSQHSSDKQKQPPDQQLSQSPWHNPNNVTMLEFSFWYSRSITNQGKKIRVKKLSLPQQSTKANTNRY